MRDVNEDSEYRDLKEQVKAKEFAGILWSGVSAVAGFGAYLTLITFAGPAAMAGVAALGLVAAFSAYKMFRTGQDVRFDTEELQARRDATNLARAMGAVRSPQEQVVMGHVVNKQRAERRAKEEQTKENVKKWVDVVTTPLADNAQLER